MDIQAQSLPRHLNTYKETTEILNSLSNTRDHSTSEFQGEDNESTTAFLRVCVFMQKRTAIIKFFLIF